MPEFEIGRMRHRVTLMRDTSTATGGQPDATYAPVATCYALVECLGGAEEVNAGQRKGTLNYRVTMRSQAVGPIRPTDQLSWDGHTLEVRAAVVDPYKILVVVEAAEYPPIQ